MRILSHILIALVATLTISCNANPQRSESTDNTDCAMTEAAPSKITLYWDYQLWVCSPTSEDYIKIVNSKEAFLFQASYTAHDGAIFGDFAELLNNTMRSSNVVIPTDNIFPDHVEIIDHNGKRTDSSINGEFVNGDIYADCLILYEYDSERKADTICLRSYSRKGVTRINSNFALADTSLFNRACDRVQYARMTHYPFN